MSFNFGAFAGGAAEGIQRGTEIARKRQEMEHIDAEEKRKSEYESELKKHDDEYQAKRAERIKQNDALLNPDSAQPRPIQDAAAIARSPAPIARSPAPIALQNPTAVPLTDAITQAANGLPSQAQAKKPATVESINDILDNLVGRARIDMKYGKADAASILQLHQAKQKLEEEGVNHAVGLIQAGDIQGGIDDFNKSGKYSGVKLIGSKPIKDKVYGNDFDGYEVTVEHPDGRHETINTISYMKQRVGMDKLLEYANKTATLKETERHNKASEKNDSLKLATTEGSTAEIKNVRFLLQNGLAKNPIEAWRMAKAGSTPSGERIISDGNGGVIVVDQDSGGILKFDRHGEEKAIRQGSGKGAQPAPQGKQPGTESDIHSKFAADPAMKGLRLGSPAPKGVEVFNEQGQLIGHYN